MTSFEGLSVGISSYYDERFKRVVHKLLPGEYFVAFGSDMILTVLGSCVSVCIRDYMSGIGGMNHFMLAEDTRERKSGWIESYDMASTRYGSNAMELLINDIIKKGGKRENLEAKVFGGASVLDIKSAIGDQNIKFAEEYLNCEAIQIKSKDVGGIYPRKIFYIPASGDVFVKKIDRSESYTIVEQEKKYNKKVKEVDSDGEIFFLD